MNENDPSPHPVERSFAEAGLFEKAYRLMMPSVVQNVVDNRGFKRLEELSVTETALSFWQMINYVHAFASFISGDTGGAFVSIIQASAARAGDLAWTALREKGLISPIRNIDEARHNE